MLDPTVTSAAFAALEQSINAVLRLDPDTLARLARLDGAVVAMELQGTGVTVYLRPMREGLKVMGHFDGVVDTTISGPPLALLRMITAEQPGTGLFGGDVSIKGDTELGQKLQRILGDLDIDWEEHLSRLTGDVLAHQVGSALRTLGAFLINAGETLGRDARDYLQEESAVLPTRGEVETHLEEVDDLRSAVDRLEARIALLEAAREKERQ